MRGTIHSLRTSQIWSVESGDMLQNLKLHSSSVHCVLYSPSGQHILSVDGIEGIIKVCCYLKVINFIVYIH